jgi:hypothetical protein
MSTMSGLASLNYNSVLVDTAANPVLKTSISGLAQTAVSLSSQNDIVATLGGASSTPVTYNAVGLLNTIVQAGTSTQPALTTSKGSSVQSIVQALFNQGVVNTLTSTPATSGIYTASGSIPGLSSNTSTNWANILKANPGVASTVISDSFNQGIVGTLSTTA